MVGAAIFTLANVAVRGAVTVHYFKYYVGTSDEPVFSLGAEGTPFFLEFAEQTESALLGIRLMFCVVPGTLAALNAVCLWFYPLGEEETAAMQAELAARRGEAAAAA